MKGRELPGLSERQQSLTAVLEGVLGTWENVALVTPTAAQLPRHCPDEPTESPALPLTGGGEVQGVKASPKSSATGNMAC